MIYKNILIETNITSVRTFQNNTLVTEFSKILRLEYNN